MAADALPTTSASSDLTTLDRRATEALADRYVIERLLGRGGMARVYAAHDRKHGRRVAIKVVDPAISVALGHERFLREVRLAASLQHANILPLFDSGQAGDLLYYVMPLVEGPSLKARITKEGPLALHEAIRVTTQVAAALDYAHGLGIVHRDIKPENILLDGDRALVADFGIAKSLDAANEALTATGVAVGTPTYMSPEQSTGERVIDGRSDIYSLGCVLYELLAGEPPFTGVSAQAVIAKRFAGPPPSVRVVRDSVPVAVDRAITRALARVAADRFVTAGEFAAALQAGAVTPHAPRIPRRFTFLLGGAAIAASVIGAIWFSTAERHAGRARRAPRDTAVVSLVRRANAELGRRTAEAIQRAIELNRQAIARDSDYADAWAGLARSLWFANNWHFPVPGLPSDSVVPLMVRASNRAVDADSTSVSAWLAKAQVLRVIDPTSIQPRLEPLRRALALDSTSAETWFAVAGLWQDSLEVRRAIDSYRRAASYNPHHTNSLAFLAVAYAWMRAGDSAAVWGDSALKLDPASTLARQGLGMARRERGEWDAARREFAAVVRLGNGQDQTFGYAGLAEIAWRRGDRHAADTLLARAVALVDTLRPALHDATYLAWGYAGTNQRDRAIRLLEAYETRFDAHFQLHLHRDPMLDALRDMPRFKALLRRADTGR